MLLTKPVFTNSACFDHQHHSTAEGRNTHLVSSDRVATNERMNVRNGFATNNSSSSAVTRVRSLLEAAVDNLEGLEVRLERRGELLVCGCEGKLAKGGRGKIAKVHAPT